MANIDYDAHYEWLCEKDEIRTELAKVWLSETVNDLDSHDAIEELSVPIGDDLAPLLLEIGRKFPGFTEAFSEAIDRKYWKIIDDHMERITDWHEEYGL